MQHSALSYLILPFTFFFFLMNSTLHQCAAEISTKAVQVCAYCSGELNVYIFIVDGCLSLCLACMYICIKDFAHVFTVTTIQSFSMWFGQQLLSPQKPNVLRFLCVFVCVHNHCVLCSESRKLPAVVQY